MSDGVNAAGYLSVINHKMNRPTKPQNYFFIKTLIWFLEAILFFALVFSLHKIFPNQSAYTWVLVSTLPWVLISQYINSFVFPSYQNQIKEFEDKQNKQQEKERERLYWGKIKSDQKHAKENKVAENIRRYKENEALRHSRAQWWQFWV